MQQPAHLLTHTAMPCIVITKGLHDAIRDCAKWKENEFLTSTVMLQCSPYGRLVSTGTCMFIQVNMWKYTRLSSDLNMFHVVVILHQLPTVIGWCSVASPGRYHFPFSNTLYHSWMPKECVLTFRELKAFGVPVIVITPVGMSVDRV